MRLESNFIQQSYEAVLEKMPSKATCAKAAVTVITSVIALEALSSIPVSSAGPVSYAACFAACSTGTFFFFGMPPAAVVCFQPCLSTLGPWCP